MNYQFIYKYYTQALQTNEPHIWNYVLFLDAVLVNNST